MSLKNLRSSLDIKYPTVLLLGAGATRGAFSNNQLPPPIDKDFFEIAGQIKGRGTRKVARNVLKSVWELYGRTNNVGLEEYYREVETRARIGSFAKSWNQPRDWTRRRKELEELIRRVFIHTTVDMNAKPPEPLRSSVHTTLFKMLRKGSTVITFNYDMLIEESFVDGRIWSPHYGFCIDVSGISLEWARHWYKRCDAQTSSEAKIQLLKLHGSLGWIQYKTNKKIRLKSRPYVVRKGIVEKISILPPGWNKPIDRNPYKELWRVARLKLESCKSLMIIGYSLPETDLLARALFSEIIRLRAARKQYISDLVLVDPSEEVKARFTEIFTPSLGPYGKIIRFESLQELGKSLETHRGGLLANKSLKPTAPRGAAS